MAMLPVDITMRDIPNSVAVETKIRQKVEKLKLLYQRIEFCKVVVEQLTKRKHQGRVFGTNIELGVPGKRLVVNHKFDEDLYVVIRDAFAAMKRQVEHYAQQQQGYVKAHMEPSMGRISRLFEDYGFIEDMQGNEFYFNASNVLNTEFNTIMVGDSVTFLENMVEDTDSPQAMHISVNKPVLEH
ncbi:MAG TPA: HPF/RaiA family ribosome-associated protein [Gammaproteobacteria bacterium]|nr:HPF/RaiA family ribosome-associated protein [Gammaproteobacteria bacterium]